MGKLIALLYGLVAYVAFFVAILYVIGFVTGLFVPKTIDLGPAGAPAKRSLSMCCSIALFAIQHSVMARPQFKTWWT